MHDLIRPDASFTPRELFARMQGAWLEPRQGSMWQENTGVTPTTSGGQKIGLLLGMDRGQPPIPGPELIVNGDGSTLTGWTTTLGSGSTITPVDGEFRFVSTGGLAVLGQTILTSGQFYSVAFSYRVVSGAAKYSIGGGAEYSFTGTGTIASIVRADGTQFYISRNFPGVAAEFYIDNISIKEIPGNHAYQATVANRPTLQFNGNLPLIRFGSNNVLTASLPAINVRRNLLTYSEQFDNAAWQKNKNGTGIAPVVTPNSALAPDGTPTADTVVFNTGAGTTSNDQSLLEYLTGSTTIGQTYTGSVYIKGSAGTKLQLRHQGAVAYHLVTLTGGWDRIIKSETAAISYVDFTIGIRQNQNGTLNSSATVYIWGAQLELGSTATEYQKITDWTSEAYSSSGSTYFATPQGMSCLHNQSIGTSYNLPALQTDNYCTVITPARLPPPLEQRLALYMHRLAGLADADFFWQEQATDGMTGQLLTDDGTILLRG